MLSVDGDDGEVVDGSGRSTGPGWSTVGEVDVSAVQVPSGRRCSRIAGGHRAVVRVVAPVAGAARDRVGRAGRADATGSFEEEAGLVAGGGRAEVLVAAGRAGAAFDHDVGAGRRRGGGRRRRRRLVVGAHATGLVEEEAVLAGGSRAARIVARVAGADVAKREFGRAVGAALVGVGVVLALVIHHDAGRVALLSRERRAAHLVKVEVAGARAVVLRRRRAEEVSFGRAGGRARRRANCAPPIIKRQSVTEDRAPRGAAGAFASPRPEPQASAPPREPPATRSAPPARPPAPA